MTWPLRSVSELCEFAFDCVNKTAPVVEGVTPYKMIRTTNVKGGFIDIKEMRYVSKDTFEKWTRRSRPRYGDVILTREAPVGEVGRCTFDEDENIFLGQRLFHYRPDPNLLDWNYLAYVLQSPEVQGRLHGRSFGATVPHVKVGDAESLLIPCPPMDVQQRIGNILANYDDLIATNQRRIALLEDAARRLYCEWFVHLRFPGHESVPVKDGMPEGWTLAAIGEILDFHIGGGWGKECSESGSSEAAYVIRGTDLSRIRDGELGGVPLRFHPERNLASRRLEPGDIVFEVSGGSRDQGVGRLLNVTAQLLEQFDKPVMCASFCKLIRPKRGLSEFLACTLEHLRVTGSIRSFENQSASNIVNFAFSEFCEKQLTLVPAEMVLRAFRSTVAPLLQQATTLAQQQAQLTRARDLLLPKLMSGQLDVSGIRLPEEVMA